MPNISPFFLLTTGSDSYIQLSTLSQIWLTLAIWWHFIILATFCGIIAANKMTMFGQQASSSAINRPFFSFPYPSFFKKMLYCLSSFFHTQLSFSQCVYRFFIYIPLIHPINNLVYSPIYFVTFLSTCTDIFLLISSHTIPSPSVYITACSWASAMRCDKSLHALKKNTVGIIGFCSNIVQTRQRLTKAKLFQQDIVVKCCVPVTSFAAKLI